MKTRYAVSSSEEIWVRGCAKFFEKFGEYDWYEVPKQEALTFILQNSNGQANPYDVRKRLHNLYESVGIKE